MIANFGNFERKGYFKASEGAENAPTFNFKIAWFGKISPAKQE